MPWNDNLTGEHYGIAAHEGLSLRVIAGPGTGKTYALMRRIARLLENGVAPESILAVTFTRTSAKDLVAQLARLGAEGADDVIARTLHSLSFSILHTNAVFQVTGRHPRLLMEHERNMLVCDLSRVFGGKRKVGELIKAFEAYWAKLQHQEPGWPADPREQAFDAALRTWLRFHEAMLVGELIPLAYDFIRDNPQSPLIPHFAHILVDEYQDLNRADQALIEALSRGTAAVTVVGDEDQSIYSFRYAHTEGITQYDRRHAGTHDAYLEECRRCPSRVVEMATSLVQRNRRARDTVLQARSENPVGNVSVVQHRSPREEAESIAAFVSHYLTENPQVHAGEVLILVTRRTIGYAIRDRINALGQENEVTWRARSFFAEECLETIPAREGFAVLTLRVDRDDRAALRAWLGLSEQSGRAAAYDRLRQHCDRCGVSPREALDALDAGTLNLPYTSALVAQYRKLTTRLAAIAELTDNSLVDAIFPDGGECEEIREIALDALATSKDVEEFLDNIRGTITQPDLPGDHDDFVRIMSLHKSKGLTARVVVIAGCVAGALPSLDPRIPPGQQLDRVEEQRRLFYVALTRTTETLVISSAVRMAAGEAFSMGLPTHLKFKGVVVLQASPFLAELGSSRPPTETTDEWRRRLGF